VTATLRRLPAWLAGGPEVSELAYRIVVLAFHDLAVPPPRPDPAFEMPTIFVTDVVAHLADQLDADEADVLRAMAELTRVGVLGRAGEEADE